MAETAQLGKLVVQMLLDPTKWQSGVESVQAGAKALVESVQRVAATVNSALSPAMDEAAKSADEVADSVNRMAGVYMDANGKLRDAAGKFVKDADALAALGNTAGLTEEQIKILQDRADKVSFEKAREGAQSFLGGLKNLAEFAAGVAVKALQAASLAGAALVAASAAVGVSFEQQMNKVGVIAGATAEEMTALTEEARRLGATTSFSATEAAQAMEVLASAGMDSSQIIAATGQAMVLAGAGGTDLATSASIVASTIAQFSLEATDAARIADVFARATADSQFQVDDLGEALKYGGPTAAAFGMSLEEAVAAMAQFRDLGLEGSMAGTALRSSLSQASQQTKINADTLAKYNLQLSDVNPQLHSFSEILATVGKAGISSTDAMVVFGVEAGGAVATLAQQAALGSTKLDDMTASLMEASGAATDMYAQMQATTAGAFAELQSAAEEVLLTLYAQYGGGLAGLLGQITTFVNEVATAIADRSDDIQAGLGAAMDVLGTYLTENGGDLATMFADGLAKAAEFSVEVAKVATMFADLIPLLDDVALTMGVIWVAQKVAAFVSALSGIVTTLGSARLALRAFMVELTAASGGIYALVAAIGVLVAGLGTLIARYVSAKDAAEELKAAQDALANKRQQEDQARIDALDQILARQQADLAGTEAQLAAAGKLTDSKKQELDLLRGLTAETAARLEAEGKLVEVGGQLRSVAALVEEANRDAADAASSGYAVIDQRVAALKATAGEAGKDFDALSEAIVRARAAAEDGGNDTLVSSILTYALGEDVKTIAEAEARLEDLKKRRKEATTQAVALENERGKVVSQILQKEVKDSQEAEASRLKAKGDAASQMMRTEQNYTDQTRDIRWKLQQELAGMEGALTDEITLEFAQRRREVEQAYADQREKAKGNSAELLRLEQDYQGALTDLTAIEAAKRDARDAQREREHADEVAEERKRLLAKLQDMQQADSTESERLEREKAAALAAISEANADLKLEIADEYNKRIEAARQKELDDAKAKADELVEKNKEATREVVAAVTSAFSAVASAVGSALEGVYGLLQDLAGAVYDLFTKLTGFSFDLAGLVSDAQSAQTAAADEGTTLTTAEAASQVMTDFFAEATSFLTFFVEAAPTILKALTDGLPGLIDAFVQGAPTILDAVLSAVPSVVGAVADALPGLVAAIVALLPSVADALLSVIDTAIPAVLAVLPDLFSGFVEAAADLVKAVIERLPSIVQGLLDLLPSLITGILNELPKLVRALLDAASDVVVALVKALPDLLSAIVEALPDLIAALLGGLIEAIPDILEALVEAIPTLILAVVGGIPQIIQTVTDWLPYIIYTLVMLIPTLIEGIVDALPELIPALIGIAGEVVAGLVEAIPEIAVALVGSLVELLGSTPDIAVAIGQAFVDGIKNAAEAIYDALVGILESVWDAIAGIFGGGDSNRNARTAASQSVNPLAGALTAVPVRVPEVDPVRVAEERRRPAAGTTGQGSAARVTVELNGRVLQEVLAVSDARGETTFRRSKSAGGAKVGISRGRYNRYAK